MKMLILDLEATCYDRGTEPNGFYSEVIEIGAVELDTATLKIGESFDTFVRPYFDPTISEFCNKLTTITEKDLIGAPTLAVALGKLSEKFPLKNMLFASWGDYDRNKLMRDCTKFSFKYPFAAHISLKTAYAEFYHVPKCGMDTALKQRRLTLVGTHHRGIDDVKNIANITIQMLKDGWRV